MSEHPGDSAINRFRAFWAGLLAFVSFGFVLWIALNAAGNREVVEPGWAERSAARATTLVEVEEAQAAAVASENVDKAIDGTITTLKAKKAAKSSLVVPGSPTFLKQAQQEAPAAEAESPAEEKPAAAPAAAPAPAPAPTPAPAKEEKPAAAPETPKPEAPAAK